MFERFTDRARKVVVVHAQDEARHFKHNYIGTEHILLGLLAEGHGIAVQVLRKLGLTHEKCRERVMAEVGMGNELVSGRIPFTPRAKKVLELALREALSLNHTYIGTEHILLGLVREWEGAARRMLEKFDIEPETVRQEVLKALAAEKQKPAPEEQSAPDLSVTRKVTVMIFDATGDGFPDQRPAGDDREYVYRKTFEKLPWPFMPLPHPEVRIDLGGNLLEVTGVYFSLDQPTMVHLDAQSNDQVPPWHAALREEGFELVPE